MALAGGGRGRVALKRDIAGGARVEKVQKVLLEKSVKRAARALAPDLADLLDVVRKAESFDEIDRLLLQKYKAMGKPSELAEALRRSAVLAKLAGQKHARDDI